MGRRQSGFNLAAIAIMGGVLLSGTAMSAHAAGLSEADRSRLIAAYPDQHFKIEGEKLVWPDGTAMDLDDGKGSKPIGALIDEPDIEDMFAMPYPPGDVTPPPAKDYDPGRARNAAFFDKMYGDCRHGGVTPKLTSVAWLPGRSGQHLLVTTVNSVDKKLAAISAELVQLDASLDAYLVPSQGTYACRVIAGTDRVSAHGYGIAIDIASKHAHYWRWSKEGPNGEIVYQSEIPQDIVRIFEKHGFIWGGKWHHYDTMHFEYRPELLPASE